MPEPALRDRHEAGRLLAALLSRYQDRPDLIVLSLTRGAIPVAYEVAISLGVPLAEHLEAQPLGDRTVILVDDGLAADTVPAAVEALRRLGPSRIVVAVAAAPAETCRSFADVADEAVWVVSSVPADSYLDLTEGSDDELRELLRAAPPPKKPQPSTKERSRMSMTGYPSFDTTVQKTNRLLKEIEQEYGWPQERRGQSYHALNAVLHALRDRLTVEESAQLAAQLPMLVRGMYYDGWNPTHVPEKMGRDEFLNRVRQEFPYEVDGGTELLVQTVFQALGHHVSEGEWNDIKSTMPRDLAAVLP